MTPTESISLLLKLIPNPDRSLVRAAYAEGLTREQIAGLVETTPDKILRPRKPSKQYVPTPSMAAKIAEAVRLRDQGMTLEAIGASMGITREWARRLLARAGRSGYLPVQPKPVVFPIKGFRNRMGRWLKAAGYHPCGQCVKGVQTWLCASECGRRNVCRKCVATRVRAAYKDPASNYKAGQIKWRKDHPELSKLYTKRYHAKPEVRERLKEKSRAQYNALRATPQGREKLRDQSRKAYARQRSKKLGTV